MQQQALIVFTRRPELGKVKTRIAATIGQAKALTIYTKLLAHTQQIVSTLTCKVFVFTTGMGTNILWNGFTINEQSEGGLGERMQHAFEELFKMGYTKVAIIGSDCLELTATLIENTFKQLDKYDVVIGPAADGGYYLLAIKKMYQPLFINKQWGTNTVYANTVSDIEKLNLTMCCLPILNDVDEIEDVPEEWL